MKDFEEQFRCSLPESFRDFYLEQNGGEVTDEEIVGQKLVSSF
ncbi:SMI1/KNR4 family protein [Streptomyces sp. NBC_01591]